MNFKDFLEGGPLKVRKFKETVALALSNFNLVEGVDIFALFFNDINIRANLVFFSKALETILPNSFAHNKLVIIILGFDGAKMLGLTIKKETTLQENLFCLDELFLEDGDWIDIGQPFDVDQAFPITIKSLIFNQNKQKTDIHVSNGQEQTLSTKKLLLSVADQTPSISTPSPSSSLLDPVRIIQAFKEFQAENKGFEILLVLTPEGHLEFTTDESFWSPEDAQRIYKAWKEHEPAFFIREDRYPILSWAELQFAARNIKGNEIVVGTKTKTNRYVMMKLDAGTKWAPNIASFVAKKLNQWSWDLI